MIGLKCELCGTEITMTEAIYDSKEELFACKKCMLEKYGDEILMFIFKNFVDIFRLNYF